MKQSTSVKDAMLRFYRRFSEGDAATFADVLSQQPDGMVIGTGPTEWIEGRDNWIAGYAEQVRAMPGIRLEANEVLAWEDGNVGWSADRPTFVLPDGTAVPVRLTTVFRREDGDWKLVQTHFSVGVAE